jgi:WhiB family transcriptional regulator, redox-sensing transcriptional regulator
VTDYRDAAGGPADAPELNPASAQDGYQRLIMQVGIRANSTDWMAHGACRRADPELFFPIAAVGSAAEQMQVVCAKVVCSRCAVGSQCLSYAQRTMPDGIWGGTTREERIGMRARPRERRPGQAEW